MNEGQEVYPINIWVNEERYRELQQAGLVALTEEVLAGLKVLRVPATAAQKEALLKRFPTAKCDTATTKTIEMLPRGAKDELFALVLKERGVQVLDDFLQSLAI